MNLFELMAKISLDTKDYDSGVKEYKKSCFSPRKSIKTTTKWFAQAKRKG